MLSRLKLTTGTVILAAVTLTGCSGGSTTTPTAPSGPPSSSPSPATADVTITINAMTGYSATFTPDPGAVKVGQTVSWKNADSTTHDIASNASLFDTGAIAPGATSAPIKMNAAGIVGYHCIIHPEMVGSLNVQ